MEVIEIPKKVIELPKVTETQETTESKELELQGKVTGTMDLPQAGINTIGSTYGVAVSGFMFIICLFFFVRGRLKNEQ